MTIDIFTENYLGFVGSHNRSPITIALGRNSCQRVRRSRTTEQVHKAYAHCWQRVVVIAGFDILAAIYAGAAVDDKQKLGVIDWLIFVLTIALFLLSFVLFFGGVGTLAKQVVDWLKTGAWVPLDFWNGVAQFLPFDRPAFNWVIPNRLLNSMLDGSRAFWLMAWAAAIYALAVWLLVWIESLDEAKAKTKDVAKPEHIRKPLTRAQKIGFSIVAAWLLLFPVAVCISLGSFDRFFAFFLMGFLVVIYGNAAIDVWKAMRTKFKARKEKGESQ